MTYIELQIYVDDVNIFIIIFHRVNFYVIFFNERDDELFIDFERFDFKCNFDFNYSYFFRNRKLINVENDAFFVDKRYN